MAMGRETPAEFIDQFVMGQCSPMNYSPNWDDMDDDCNALLNEICEKYVQPTEENGYAGASYSISLYDMNRSDCQPGWAVCMFAARRLIDIEMDHRDRKIIIIPRYPTLARWKTHGFERHVSNGADEIANPHRKRAVNLGN